MSYFKTKPVRSKHLMKAANGRPCVRCGSEDGTVVRCHYTGARQHEYGKGRGIKGHDCIAADLCLDCHGYYDHYEWAKGLTKGTPEHLFRATEADEEFLHLCVLTMIRDVEDGLITIKGWAA